MRKNLKSLKRIVIKIGSQVIIEKGVGLRPESLREICQDVKELIESGIEVILISSGAIGVGRNYLEKPSREEVSFLQAASAIGQPILFNRYLENFQGHNLNCAQILLTHEDFKNRKRYLNAKNTITKLLENKVVPILNENDTVSFNEITVGDNDHLAAMTAQMLEANLLVIISSTDGLYTKSPELPDSEKISLVEFNAPPKVITKSKNALGRGGMQSKLKAVDKVNQLGIDAIISGIRPHAIKEALYHETGTLFQGNPQFQTKKKKQWLTTTVKNSCAIIVDEGCAEALKKNRSLLPSGIKKIVGDFSRGDCIEIVHKKITVAVGLVEYSSKEIERIKGLKSRDIQGALGFILAEEVIHRNNLILKGNL